MAGLDAINKLPFLGVTSAPRVEGGSKAAPVERTGYVEPASYGGGTPFDNGHLVGVNTNIGVGDYQDGPTQAGYKLGGRTLGFA